MPRRDLRPELHPRRDVGERHRDGAEHADERQISSQPTPAPPPYRAPHRAPRIVSHAYLMARRGRFDFGWRR